MQHGVAHREAAYSVGMRGAPRFHLRGLVKVEPSGVGSLSPTTAAGSTACGSPLAIDALRHQPSRPKPDSLPDPRLKLWRELPPGLRTRL